ncbi:hypothetical protein DCC39_17435 [Pueribacillus theae]|uniref:DUF5668 domain-containing protein n=1 Tax=Pueribacillus theae TaxID=2171751 RepID=A0A2U1JNC5_9BACI|nr:hypothetical protein [Pueribacillus theae]PWA06393.1 hypothetical protein DCC39_17435 [Pueribacillus theae]
MRNHHIFIGILLLGVGLFFFLDSLHVTFIQTLLDWQFILIVIGIAFLAHGFLGKEAASFFPGTLLLGLGIHFFAAANVEFWPKSWGMYTLIVGVAFLVQYFKTKKGGFLTACILIMISLLELFYANFQLILMKVETLFKGFWPILLIGLGLYFLFFKKK